jgi:hypothetical protein
MQGWIKLHRQITENEFWYAERFTKAQAWIDLLLLATHTERTVFIRGIEISLRAGELCYSQKSLAQRWKWNVKTVSAFLSMLSQRKMLETRTDNVTTVISITNWKHYQKTGEQSGHQNGEQKDTRTETNKNDKNGENVVASLAQCLNDNKIDFDEEDLKARIPTALAVYGEKILHLAVNNALRGWKNSSHNGNFVSYLFTVLDRNYLRLDQ